MNEVIYILFRTDTSKQKAEKTKTDDIIQSCSI